MGNTFLDRSIHGSNGFKQSDDAFLNFAFGWSVAGQSPKQENYSCFNLVRARLSLKTHTHTQMPFHLGGKHIFEGRHDLRRAEEKRRQWQRNRRREGLGQQADKDASKG